jgi:hypothetical protein
VWGQGIKAKWQTMVGGGVILLVLMASLDLWTPKPDQSTSPATLAGVDALLKRYFGGASTAPSPIPRQELPFYVTMEGFSAHPGESREGAQFAVSMIDRSNNGFTRPEWTQVYVTTFLSITNNETRPTSVVNYTLESKNRYGKWVRMCRLATLYRDVYAVFTDPHRAAKWDLDNYGFDRLASKGRTITEGESMAGWVFFFNPTPKEEESLLKQKKMLMSWLEVRITLALSDGRVITVPVSFPTVLGRIVQPKMEWAPGYYDLSKLLEQEPYESFCM